MDHFPRNKKDGTLKITPFYSEECAESIGTVRWTLATSNVEIIDPINIFQNGRFLAKKGHFSRKRLVRSSSKLVCRCARRFWKNEF